MAVEISTPLPPVAPGGWGRSGEVVVRVGRPLPVASAWPFRIDVGTGAIEVFLPRESSALAVWWVVGRSVSVHVDARWLGRLTSGLRAVMRDAVALRYADMERADGVSWRVSLSGRSLTFAGPGRPVAHTEAQRVLGLCLGFEVDVEAVPSLLAGLEAARPPGPGTTRPPWLRYPRGPVDPVPLDDPAPLADAGAGS
jgi:hypothetical protein